jgi:hypothetical protein
MGFGRFNGKSPRKLASRKPDLGKPLAGGGNPKPMRPLDLPKPIKVALQRKRGKIDSFLP